METGEIILNGRKYSAYISPDEQAGAYVIIGPPEGLVDGLGLTEELATQLHNILYTRGILHYAEACRKNVLFGVLQELFALDAQRLLEKFNEFEKEVVI